LIFPNPETNRNLIISSSPLRLPLLKTPYYYGSAEDLDVVLVELLSLKMDLLCLPLVLLKLTLTTTLGTKTLMYYISNLPPVLDSPPLKTTLKMIIPLLNRISELWLNFSPAIPNTPTEISIFLEKVMPEFISPL